MTDSPSSPDDNEVDEYFPQFSTVRRGYDPTEVEQVLDELYASLDAALRETREKAQELHLAQQARRQSEDALHQSREELAQLQQRLSDEDPPSLDALGSRIANIVKVAATEAAEITRAAREEAQVLQDTSRTIHDQAQAEADRLVAHALETHATVRAQLADVRLRLAGLMPATRPETGPPDDLPRGNHVSATGGRRPD